MRIAGVYDCFGSNRVNTYLPVHFMSCIVVRPTVKQLLAIKYRTSASKDGVHCGATAWPEGYDPKPNESIPQHLFKKLLSQACPVKAANRVYRCAFNPDIHDYVPVEATTTYGVYVDEYGNKYRCTPGEDNQVFHWYYDSKKMAQADDNYINDRPLGINEGYYHWMQNQHCDDESDNCGKLDGRVIDISKNAGYDMARVVDSVYHGRIASCDRIPIPDFYFRTSEVLEYRDEAVDEFIINAANNPGLRSLDCEMSPYNGLVTEISHTNGSVRIRINKLIPSGNNKSSSVAYELDSESYELEYPNPNGTLEVLVNAHSQYEVGEVVDSSHAVPTNQPIVRVLPHGPYEDIKEIESIVGADTMAWLRQEIIKQHIVYINGRRAVSLHLINELPAVVDPKAFFVRNRRYVFAINDVKPEDLVLQPNKFVKIDWLHHPWFRSHELATSNTRDDTLRINSQPALAGGIEHTK